MVAFVLVHGSFHGPWCWDRMVPLLHAAGHTVMTPDLADAATDKPYPDLHDYAALVAAAVRAAGAPVVLVGHSMGGLVVSQAAALAPDDVRALVYVSGLLLRDGETLQSFLQNHGDLGVDDLVLKHMQVSRDGQSASFPAAMAPAVFYNRCAAADAAWATARLRVQPTAVYATPLRLHDGFAAVPRAYIVCEDDQAVPIAYQRQMLANTPCGKTYSLDADHSPFLSDASGLMACLQELVVADESNMA